MARLAFDKVFPDGTMFKPALDDTILGSSSSKLKIQSAFWKFSLVLWKQGMESVVTSAAWSKTLLERRQEYKEIRDRFWKAAPADDSSVDPLEIQAQDSKWGQYYRGEQTKKILIRDMNRMFFEGIFYENDGMSDDQSAPFRNQSMNKVLQILFLHLCENPHIVYQQGYHELCAICYYVMKREMKSTEVARDDPNFYYSLLFSEDSDAVDADTYWVYSRIIEFVAPYHQPSEGAETVSDACLRVQTQLMATYDTELAGLLENVYPNYMEQWFFLLFERLFPLDSIAAVWSKLFVFIPDLKIVEELAAQVLLNSKELLTSDEADVQTLTTRIRCPDPEPVMRNAIRRMTQIRAANKSEPGKGEAICRKIEAWLPNGLTAPKDEVIAALATFRDAFMAVIASDGILDSTVYGNEPVSESETSSAQVRLSPDVELCLPRASGLGAAANESLDAILTSEGQETSPLRRKRSGSDLFARKSEIADLFT